MARLTGTRQLPATARQRLVIARLAIDLGIREPIEEVPMTIGEAGREIRYMVIKIRSKRR